MGLFIGARERFEQGKELNEFEVKAKDMADLIETLGRYDPGSQIPLEITVPTDCEIIFENESVVVNTGSKQTHDTGIEIVGSKLNSGNYNLTLIRTQKGVEINAG